MPKFAAGALVLYQIMMSIMRFPGGLKSSVMQTKILNLLEHHTHSLQVNTTLSIKPFIRFLEQKIAESSGMRAQRLGLILEQIKAHPLWDADIVPERIEEFRELFEWIHVTLSAPVTDEQTEYWALSIPFTPILFFGTNAMFDMLQDRKGHLRKDIMPEKEKEAKELTRLTYIYGMILEKCYGFPMPGQDGVVQQLRDEATGLNKYFLLEFDTRFVDVSYEGSLPKFDIPHIGSDDDSKREMLRLLQQQVPLDRFRFTGFSIIHIRDITAQHAIERIKDIIVNLAPGRTEYDDITGALKEIMGSSQMDVHLMPVIKVNEKLATHCTDTFSETMSKTSDRYEIPLSTYISTIQRYSEDPQLIFRKNVDEVMAGEDEMFPMLRRMGVKALAVIPIFFQKKLVGILTMYAMQHGVLSEHVLASIEPTIPLLEQLMQTAIDDFQIMIDNTVKEKFTSLQPAIEWRFNDVAYNYLQRKTHDPGAEIEQVYFQDVYPLYGAVDIRNSTVERNNALRLDMQLQLQLLTKLLDEQHHKHVFGLTGELLHKTRMWADQISEFISSEDELQLSLFLEEEVAPFLEHFGKIYPAAAAGIQRYFEATKPGNIAHTNRTALEESLQMINRSISKLLDLMNAEIQQTYPSYFEKFRSDGIEYNIYIGQSITPDRPFHPLYLQNLRLWQLTTMANIARQTAALQASLPRPLQTTQLIFVHANTIDISFRGDEHRFDVEGAYNIRYEMIKKRIDKVHIRDTEERLTQPNKIALVYFQHKDVEEYLSHIHYLQNQQILADEVEFLELEELQGVNGLKAIRVAILPEPPARQEPEEHVADYQVVHK